MREKPFSKITVNEIAQAAGVNRSTWFRNFETKNEALTFKLVRVWYRWADDRGMKERCRYTPDNAEDFFAFNDSIQELLSEIYREGLQACVYNAFYQAMMSPIRGRPCRVLRSPVLFLWFVRTSGRVD